MKIAFITSLFGQGRGNLPSRDFVLSANCDYFFFTESCYKNLKTPWNIYDISNNSNIAKLNCNVRKSRYAKFMGWELLESMDLKYDFIYYCDAHWSPLPFQNWEALSSNILKLDFPFWQNKHPHISTGIADEIKLIISCKRDSAKNMKKTLSFFESNYPDINLLAGQYFENKIFGYHPNSIVRSVTKEFWDTYIAEDITFRDQPLWNLLLLKNKVLPFSDVGIQNKFAQTGSYGNHIYA